MASSGVSVMGLTATFLGGLFIYSGIKGLSITGSLRQLLSGQAPTAPGTDTLASVTAAGSGAAEAGSGPVSNPSQYQQYAFSLFSQYGWGADQQQPLVSLWNQESGWNPNAQNPTSTAYGIAQFLDNTWATVGGSKTSNAETQIQYGLKYIDQRYGSPAGAWAHEQKYNWY